MIWADLEKAFHRAFVLSISKKKLSVVFPALTICGLLFVFCQTLALHASHWVAMSLMFVPILLSSAILFCAGVLVIRLHHHEAKRLVLDVKKLLYGSLDLMIGVSYLSLLPLFAYLLLWVALGVFFLLKEIPGIGQFFSVVFSFAPFLLIFTSLILCLGNIAFLFFGTPAAALQPLGQHSFGRRVVQHVVKKILSSFVLFFVGLIPFIIVGGLLLSAAKMTQLHFLIAEHSLSIALEWFFMMLPFCALLTPTVVFFFNFAAESYQMLQGISSSLHKMEESAL